MTISGIKKIRDLKELGAAMASGREPPNTGSTMVALADALVAVNAALEAHTTEEADYVVALTVFGRRRCEFCGGMHVAGHVTSFDPAQVPAIEVAQAMVGESNEILKNLTGNDYSSDDMEDDDDGNSHCTH